MPGPKAGNNSNVGKHTNSGIKGLAHDKGMGGMGLPTKQNVDMPSGPTPSKSSQVPTGKPAAADVK